LFTFTFPVTVSTWTVGGMNVLGCLSISMLPASCSSICFLYLLHGYPYTAFVVRIKTILDKLNSYWMDLVTGGLLCPLSLWLLFVEQFWVNYLWIQGFKLFSRQWLVA
jgi:hypothetical protein